MEEKNEKKLITKYSMISVDFFNQGGTVFPSSVLGPFIKVR